MRAVSLVAPVTSSQLRDLLARINPVIDLDKLQDNTPFIQAGADSFDLFFILCEVQNATQMDIADDDIERVTTLEGLAGYLNSCMA